MSLPLGDLSIFVDALGSSATTPSCFADKTLEHPSLSAAAVGIALLIALPLGSVSATCTAARSSRSASRNVGRALPSSR